MVVEFPIRDAEADRLFACLEAARGVGLAVSGGADSIALMRLFASWRDRRHPDLCAHVFTVDHGLRPESAEEAQSVARWSAGLGLPHETLCWSDDKPATGIQAAAREARYRLMSRRCVGLGLTHLLTAHHLDDQAETVLMRLARGSGVDGLAAMARHKLLDGPVLTRPLLDLPKSRLVATLRALGQPWIDDPSNDDPRFARARMRRLMPLLAEEGLTASRLAEFARKAARARDALDAATASALAEAVVEDPAGFCRIDPAALASAPSEIGLRVIERLLVAVGGGNRPVRQARLERLHSALMDSARGASFAGATLGGCRIVPSGGEIVLYRELGRRPPPPTGIRPRSAVLWDGRFRIRLSDDVPGDADIRPLGRYGLAALRRSSSARPMPAGAAQASPGVFVSGELHAAPQLEACRGPFSPPGVEIAFIGSARYSAAAAGAN